jgi:hypothetical protein
LARTNGWSEGAGVEHWTIPLIKPEHSIPWLAPNAWTRLGVGAP